MFVTSKTIVGKRLRSVLQVCHHLCQKPRAALSLINLVLDHAGGGNLIVSRRTLDARHRGSNRGQRQQPVSQIYSPYFTYIGNSWVELFGC
jgi:hypothetical protein